MEYLQYLRFIDNVLKNIRFSEKVTARFREMYEHVLRRYEDPTLYLSLLSSFSAGKSTLINSLIGFKLLKTANEATTSIPTFIRQCNTEDVRIRIVFHDGRKYALELPEERELLAKTLRIFLPGTTEDLIRLFTTDELRKKGNSVIYENVAQVDIDVPGKGVVENLCIIDTPGVNAGSVDASHHVDATISSLKNNTDAAMILFPAHQAYTQSFEEFLEANASSMLCDSIYVLSMMDLVNEEEQQEVIDSVANQLKGHFHLSDPTILYCAAGRIRTSKEWAEQFEEFTRVLYGHLRTNKEEIIARRIKALLQEILSELSQAIELKNQSLMTDMRILQESAPPDLVKLLDKYINSAMAAIASEQKNFEYRVSQWRSMCVPQIEYRIKQKLEIYSNRSEIESYAKNNLQKDIEEVCSGCNALVSETLSVLDSIIKDTCQKMNDALWSYYGQIEGMNAIRQFTQDDHKASLITTDKIELTFEQASNFNFGIDLAAVAAGIGIGATILAALGPIGWIGGGLIALIAGDKLFVKEMKNKVIAEVFPKLPGIVDTTAKRTKDVVNGAIAKSKCQLVGKRDAITLKYSSVYRDVCNQYNNRKKALEMEMEQTRTYMALTKARLNQINQSLKGEKK